MVCQLQPATSQPDNSRKPPSHTHTLTHTLTHSQDGVKDLETRKFLPLMYQLAARMSARTLNSDPFQQTLQSVRIILYLSSLLH